VVAAVIRSPTVTLTLPLTRSGDVRRPTTAISPEAWPAELRQSTGGTARRALHADGPRCRTRRVRSSSRPVRGENGRTDPRNDATRRRVPAGRDAELPVRRDKLSRWRPRRRLATPQPAKAYLAYQQFVRTDRHRRIDSCGGTSRGLSGRSRNRPAAPSAGVDRSLESSSYRRAPSLSNPLAPPYLPDQRHPGGRRVSGDDRRRWSSMRLCLGSTTVVASRCSSRPVPRAISLARALEHRRPLNSSLPTIRGVRPRRVLQRAVDRHGPPTGRHDPSYLLTLGPNRADDELFPPVSGRSRAHCVAPGHGCPLLPETVLRGPPRYLSSVQAPTLVFTRAGSDRQARNGSLWGGGGGLEGGRVCASPTTSPTPALEIPGTATCGSAITVTTCSTRSRSSSPSRSRRPTPIDDCSPCCSPTSSGPTATKSDRKEPPRYFRQRVGCDARPGMTRSCAASCALGERDRHDRRWLPRHVDAPGRAIRVRAMGYTLAGIDVRVRTGVPPERSRCSASISAG